VVVFAEHTNAICQDLLVKGDCFVCPAHRPVRLCEVVARGQGVGVVFVQDASTVFGDLLVQGDGLL